MNVPTSQMIPASHPPGLATAISPASTAGNGAPVFIIYKPSQALKPSSPAVVHPGLNGATIVQTTNNQILNGATIVQAQPLAPVPGADAHVVNGAMMPSQSSPVAILPQSPKLNGTVIRDGNHQQPSLLSSATVVQANPTLVNGATILQANGQPALLQANGQPLHKFSHPQPTILSVPQTISTCAPRTVTTVATTSTSASPRVQTPVRVIDISNLTKEANHGHKSPPPPLLQVGAADHERCDMEKSPPPKVQVKEPPQVVRATNGSHTSAISGSIVGQTVMLQSSGNGIQKYFVVAEKPDSSMLVLSAAHTQQPDAGNLRTQIVPVPAYDQQVVTTMPIYRFNSLNTIQPIQILTPVAASNSMTTA